MTIKYPDTAPLPWANDNGYGYWWRAIENGEVVYYTRLYDMGVKTMKFRPQRGSLKQSMSHMVEVEGLTGLIAHLRSYWPLSFDDDTVTLEPYGGDDSRIGWKDVHIVLVNGAPAGFTATED